MARHSFKLSVDQFMAKRGGAAIVSRGKALKRSNAALFAQIEQRYGVPAGPLLAIWGMETGFGAVRGNQHLVSAVATLAYDCRRTDYFTDQLYAALKLIDQGTFNANTIASMPWRGRPDAVHAEDGAELCRGQPRDVDGRDYVDREFPEGPWLVARRRISARRNQFRGDPGMERRFGLSARDRRSSARRSTASNRAQSAFSRN